MSKALITLSATVAAILIGIVLFVIPSYGGAINGSDAILYLNCLLIYMVIALPITAIIALGTLPALWQERKWVNNLLYANVTTIGLVIFVPILMQIMQSILLGIVWIILLAFPLLSTLGALIATREKPLILFLAAEVLQGASIFFFLYVIVQIAAAC